MVAERGVRDGRAWVSAPCLQTLRAEVAKRWPDRPESPAEGADSFDGTIGDAAHASRSSWHNPHADTPGFPDSVDASDFAHSSAWDSYAFCRELAKTRDYRIAGIGSYDPAVGREMWWAPGHDQRANAGWVYQDLHGASHKGHGHVECTHTHAARYDTRPWGIAQEDIEMTPEEIKAIVVAAIREEVPKAVDDALDREFTMNGSDGKPKVDGLRYALAAAARKINESTRL